MTHESTLFTETIKRSQSQESLMTQIIDDSNYRECIHESWLITEIDLNHTELAKNFCPRLRDLATVPAGRITQPWTHFFGQLCRHVDVYLILYFLDLNFQLSYKNYSTAWRSLATHFVWWTTRSGIKPHISPATLPYQGLGWVSVSHWLRIDLKSAKASSPPLPPPDPSCAWVGLATAVNVIVSALSLPVSHSESGSYITPCLWARYTWSRYIP